MGRTQKNQNVVEVGNIQLGFLSEKIDNFQNELVYFAITDKDWKTKMRFIQAIAEGNKALKVPYFMGDQGHPILRVKKNSSVVLIFGSSSPSPTPQTWSLSCTVSPIRKARNLRATIVKSHVSKPYLVNFESK